MDILHAVSPADLGVLALGLVISGVVGGLVAGALDIAGGIVVVPVLYHVLATLGLAQSVRMHVAIGTALAAGVPAALSAHGPLGSADRSVLREWILPALLGTALGSFLLALASGRTLAFVFTIGAAVVVLSIILGGRDQTVALSIPGPAARFGFPLLVGVTTALTGMGGRTAALPVARLCRSEGLRRAENMSLLAAIVAIPAAMGAGVAGWGQSALPPDSLGYVNLLGFALIAPILLLMERAGATLAHIMDLKRLRLVVSALVVVTTARMLWDALA